MLANSLDDIVCIGQLDNEPQCTFQISKVEETIHYGQLCHSFGFSNLQVSNITIFFAT